MVRILQRILALTAAIWHNDHTAAPVHRSLTAYDHRPSPRSSSGCCEARPGLPIECVGVVFDA